MDSKNLLLVAVLSGLAFAASANEEAKNTILAKEATAIEGQCFGVNSCKGTAKPKKAYLNNFK